MMPMLKVMELRDSQQVALSIARIIGTQLKFLQISRKRLQAAGNCRPPFIT
jgi:hypothetical protein